MSKIGDLKVYRKLVDLHLQVHELSLGFPQFELFELGSQIRRASNSVPANLAEGSNNRHPKTYLQSIGRALGELRETQHHLMIAFRKKYLSQESYTQLIDSCTECARMPRGIGRAISRKTGES